MPTAAGAVQILVVDDDVDFRAFLRVALERAGFDVHEADDGAAAIAVARLTQPSLVVLDVRLPGISGYEVLRELHETVRPEMPVILVSGERTEKEDTIGGLLLGADDYLAKPFDPDELLARIRRSLGRGARAKPQPEDRSTSPLAALSRRELQVLELLTDGLTQAEIAARLVLSPRTVGTHIQHILSKLDVHNRAQAVALALRSGLDRWDVAPHAQAGAAR
jgi:DNA-binding NarL/FixJ family response regulator